MRILHAADFGGAAPGGFVPMLTSLADRLRARGDAVGLVVPTVEGASWHDGVRAAGVELHVVDGAAAAGRFARAWRPDLAHVHFFGWEPAVTLALWPTRARIIWHAHSTSLRNGRVRGSIKSAIKYRVLGSRVERFVAVSRAVGREIALLGAPEDRIVAVHNAIDRRRFRPPSRTEREAARAALGLAANEQTVLFFGRDPYLKGADVLEAALAHIPWLTVVTVATPEPTRRALAQYAGRLIAVDRSEDVVPLLWAADALALPSRGEGFSLALLEAASTGLPVAASDLPALREAAEQRPHVRYAKGTDDAAFAAALREALDGGRVEDAYANGGLSGWSDRITALYDSPASAPGLRR